MPAGREPLYLSAQRNGRLQQKIDMAFHLLQSCTLCPRYCRVNRTKGELGYCGTGPGGLVSSHGPHHGEEPPISGTRGSGTIFLTRCNLRCTFCQNYSISILGMGKKHTPAQIASLMLDLAEKGCHNINLVTPTHQLPILLQSLQIAAQDGLRLPIVWNCGGYESPQAMELLEGIVDIYMPDFKFWSEEAAARYANAPDYPDAARKAIKEMHRQAGDLTLDEKGVAVSGLLVRHLLMPGGQDCTDNITRWVKREISPNTYLNLMNQYHPT